MADTEYARTLSELLSCCKAWEPDVCVMGNVRAGDAAKALEFALAAIPAASLREQEIASFQLLQWTTDDAGRGIALVNGRTYSHAQVCRLRDELAEVAKIGSGAAPSSEGDEGSGGFIVTGDLEFDVAQLDKGSGGGNGEAVERDGCDPALLGKKIGYYPDGEPFGYITEQERADALAARAVNALSPTSPPNGKTADGVKGLDDAQQ